MALVHDVSPLGCCVADVTIACQPACCCDPPQAEAPPYLSIFAALYFTLYHHLLQVDYIISGPVVCMVWEGMSVIKIGRDMIGESARSS